MRNDPESPVRVYALRALRKVLHTACEERQWSLAQARTGDPVVPTVASGPWVEATARAIIGLAVDDDPEVRGHAVGFLAGSKPSKTVLTVEERIAALRPLVLEEDGPRLPTDVDLLVLNEAAYLMGPTHPDAPAMIDLLLRRIADPPLSSEFAENRDRMLDQARGGYTRILWHLIGSATDFRRSPELAAVLLPTLSGDGQTFMRSNYAGDQLHQRSNRFTGDVYTGGGAYFYGGRAALPEPRRMAMKAFGDDPAILALIWPTVDRPGRIEWLAGRSPSPGGHEWKSMMIALVTRVARPDLPPAEVESILARLLDEPAFTDAPDDRNSEPGDSPFDANDDPEGPLRDVIQQVKNERSANEAQDFATTPLEAARQIVEVRNLAILTYFARGTGPEANNDIHRLVDRLRVLLASEQRPVRMHAADLLGSLGPRAGDAAADLEALAEHDAEELVRLTAAAALEAIRTPTDPEGHHGD
jgi:hypothetical protein